MTALPVTPESGLVLEDILITPTRVETQPAVMEIMATRTSKPWGTSWCSKVLELTTEVKFTVRYKLLIIVVT